MLLKVEAQQAVDISFFKPSRKRTKGDAQIKIYNEEKRRHIIITPEEPKLPQADVFNSLFQCHPSAVVFFVLPDYDHPAHQNRRRRVDQADPHLPASLDGLYDLQSITLPACDFKQLCSRVFNELKISKEEANFLETATRSQSSSTVW